jgi:hypothetical protein
MQEKKKLQGEKGFLKHLKSRFVLNASFNNNDYFDFILQLTEDNHEIFGMKFTDYNDIIDFMKLDQSKGPKDDVLVAHETMNYIKSKKEQFEQENKGSKEIPKEETSKQVNLDFFPVPPKKIPPTGLILKTNAYRQGVVEVEGGPKPGSAGAKDKDPLAAVYLLSPNAEKKNSGIATNLRSIGGSSAKKNPRENSRENR